MTKYLNGIMSPTFEYVGSSTYTILTDKEKVAFTIDFEVYVASSIGFLTRKFVSLVTEAWGQVKWTVFVFFATFTIKMVFIFLDYSGRS